MDAKQRFAEPMRDPCFAPGDEIREILLHSAIYSEFPKAVAAFRAAREALDEPETKTLAEENARKMARQ